MVIQHLTKQSNRIKENYYTINNRSITQYYDEQFPVNIVLDKRLFII